MSGTMSNMHRKFTLIFALICFNVLNVNREYMSLKNFTFVSLLTECKKARAEIKKAASDTVRLQKKVKKGSSKFIVDICL